MRLFSFCRTRKARVCPPSTPASVRPSLELLEDRLALSPFYIAPTEGVAFTNQELTSFGDLAPNVTAHSFKANIDWGDGSQSAGKVVKDPGQQFGFDVLGSHDYHEAGSLRGARIVVTGPFASNGQVFSMTYAQGIYVAANPNSGDEFNSGSDQSSSSGTSTTDGFSVSKLTDFLSGHLGKEVIARFPEGQGQPLCIDLVAAALDDAGAKVFLGSTELQVPSGQQRLSPSQALNFASGIQPGDTIAFTGVRTSTSGNKPITKVTGVVTKVDGLRIEFSNQPSKDSYLKAGYPGQVPIKSLDLSTMTSGTLLDYPKSDVDGNYRWGTQTGILTPGHTSALTNLKAGTVLQFRNVTVPVEEETHDGKLVAVPAGYVAHYPQHSAIVVAVNGDKVTIAEQHTTDIIAGPGSGQRGFETERVIDLSRMSTGTVWMYEPVSKEAPAQEAGARERSGGAA